jgi:hypothetical protein
MTTETEQQLHEAADILRQFALATENGSTAVLHPGIVALFSDWLGCLSALDPAEGGSGQCEWCEGGNHAEITARAIVHLGNPASRVVR